MPSGACVLGRVVCFRYALGGATQSYNGKHNDANGEGNRDGTNDNFSWNCGHEGATGNEGINALRQRQQRNAFVMLLLSAGTPMMVMGEH